MFVNTLVIVNKWTCKVLLVFLYPIWWFQM